MRVYEIITNRIMESLEKGVVPWHKPWACKEALPCNFVSKKQYRGINVFLLHMMGYTSRYWLTFKQVKKLGGSIIKGEKSCPVIFWNWIEVKDEEDEIKEKPFLRYYSAFNLAQCEGINDPDEPVVHDFNPIKECESIVENMPQKPAIQHSKRRACYSPLLDEVSMPQKESFEFTEAYYSTLFHELTHSTGHSNRLNRKGVIENQPFGTADYSKEELVAEMGAAFICGCAGIENMIIDNSAAYIANWLKKLKDDKKLVILAAAQAQKAADFILDVKK